MVGPEKLQANQVQDDPSERVVLLLAKAADRSQQQLVVEADEGCAAPGEVTPWVQTILIGLRLDDTLERQVVAGYEVECVDTVSGGRTQLANGICAVALTLRTPAGDEPGQLVGVVPDLSGVVLAVEAGVCHREAEAAVVVDLALSSHVGHQGVLQCLDDPTHADALTEWTDGLVPAEAGHVQCTWHGISLQCSRRHSTML